MTTVEQAELGATNALTERRRRRWFPKRGSNLWRHLVAIAGIVFALFPIVYVTGAAFNEIPTLVGASATTSGRSCRRTSPIRPSRRPTSPGGT